MKCESAEIEQYSISLVETLNSLRHQELFVDFQIAVSGEDFPVHQNVLAASCKFFRDLFKVSGAAARYELTNVEPTAVRDILYFFYSGKCRLQGQQKAESALSIANVLGKHELKEPLERYLSLVKESSAFDSTGIWEEFSFCCEESLLKAIMEFWVEGLFCDLTLTTKSGKIVPVHKNVIAAVSCYFQGLFRSDVREVHENNVDLSMVDETGVNELLHFIYSGEISITFHNIRNLLHATDYLMIEHLRTAIVAFLKGSSTVSNFWCIFDLAKSFHCLSEINIDILHLTRRNFWEISPAEEFLEITEEELEYFWSNDDIMSSEVQMLSALICWYKYSTPQREESFKNLLYLVHMTSIPDLYLKYLAEREGIDELHSYTGHQLRAKVSLDDLKRSAHFYNLVMFGLARDPDCLGNQLCYWLPFAGPWSYITYSYSCFETTTPLVFTGDAFYLRFYGLNPQLTFFKNPLNARHFKHSSTLCSPTLVERVSESTAPQDCSAVPLGSSIYFTGGQVHYEAHRAKCRDTSGTFSIACSAKFESTRVKRRNTVKRYEINSPGRLSQACNKGASTTLQSTIEKGVFMSLGALKVWGV